ncbi:MAG: hypothetical protein AB7K52_00580 [Phycisphaerales bacterium]
MTLPAAKSLTPRDENLLHALTHRVRVLTLNQVARTFWAGASETSAAEPRLDQLCGAGLLERLVRMAHPELPLSAPLATWQPGLPRPALTALARQLRSRWRLPDTATVMYTATRAAAALTGGHGDRPLRTSETTHDIHLAGVYLLMRRELPTRARSWKSEARLLAEGRGRHEKLPDAVVTDGRSETAIEFGGMYSADKLAAFHDHCHHSHLGYELW